MTLISLVCLLVLSSTVFSRSVISPSDNGYGATRALPSVENGYGATRALPSVENGYGATRALPSINNGYGATRALPSVNNGYGSTRSNPLPPAPQPSANYGYGSSRSNPLPMTRALPTAGLNAALKTAVTEVERQSLLADEQFVFDFINTINGVTKGAGGRVVAASAKNFPALIGHGIAMTVGFIDPCGINLPHTHPRATEINFAAVGTLQAGLFQENGARLIMNRLDTGKATVFPQGGVHFEINLECESAMFVAAFNSEDPGVQTVADAFFGGLPADVVGASLGGLNVTTVESLKALLPANVALGVDECRQRCGV